MMTRTRWRWAAGIVPLGAVVAVLLWTTAPAIGQAGQAAQSVMSIGTAKGEWPTYGGDLASMRYSPLDQINADNFNKLEVAWRFKTDGARPAAGDSTAGHAADGERRHLRDRRHPPRRRRARCGDRRAAVDAQRERRQARRSRAAPALGPRPRPTGPTATATTRIVYVTPGYQMIALNAKTGALDRQLRQERHRRSEAGR